MLSIYDCPYCGAINQGEPQYSHLIDDQSYCEVMTCLECGKEYHHIYQLVRVDVWEEDIDGSYFKKEISSHD